MMTEKQSLLLIENDDVTVSLYERELNPSFSLFICSDEDRAAEILASNAIAAVVFEPARGNDWVWNFLSVIKADPTTANIPVIFCSILDERKKGFELGAASYLVKPVYAHILRQQIEDLIQDN